MPQNTAIVSFNPTAKALQYDGTNLPQVVEFTSAAGIKELPDMQPGTYVVLFMGQVTLMGEQGYRSAMGLS